MPLPGPSQLGPPAHLRPADRAATFFKTPAPGSPLETHADGQKRFRYQGPIPEIVLGWALSALPADLKRYAFVDFEAGNGRTLLLAARKNFEHAIGYTHDSESSAMLEMNLAQYSRSCVSCRDVRALREDRDGVPISMQPAVLFFPHSLSPANLANVLGHLTASLRLNPRPVYLIFENAGPKCEGGQVNPAFPQSSLAHPEPDQGNPAFSREHRGLQIPQLRQRAAAA